MAWLAVLGLAACLVGCVSNSPASIQTTRIPRSTPTFHLVGEAVGHLHDWVRRLEKEMPQEGSQAYVVANQQEQAAFAEIAGKIESGDIRNGEILAAQYHYHLSPFPDREHAGATSYLLVEAEPIQKGWGLYAFRDGATSHILVEAPHPISDENTSVVAVDVYQRLNAQALLIAGAHRNANQGGSADVAHVPESIFQSVHAALLQTTLQEGGQPIVLQIHGYASAKHPGYPNVVLGLGLNPGEAGVSLAHRIVHALEANNISAGICTETSWKDLCATKNLQSAAMKNGIFIQLEMDEPMRLDDAGFVAALAQALGK